MTKTTYLTMYLAYSTDYFKETYRLGKSNPIGVYKTRDKAIRVIKRISGMDKTKGNAEEKSILNQAQGLIYTVTPVEVEVEDDF